MAIETAETYNLPEEFFNFIKEYLSGTQIKNEQELISLWQKALDCAKRYPTMRESIAEWTMSIGANTPFIHDNDYFEAIHLGFGSLEVADSSNSDANTEWEDQIALFEEFMRSPSGKKAKRRSRS